MEEKQFEELKAILEHIESLLDFLCHRAIDVSDKSYYRWTPCDPETARLFAEARQVPKKRERADA